MVDPRVSALQNKAFENGIYITEALGRASPVVSRSTWWRAKHGKTPHQSTLDRVEAALEKIIAERAQAPANPPEG